ncbi:MAG: hypothetical protein KDB22_03680 [Planctomycetales bacterium]|nr:hypothetical protein [Planctomycetales bacterium]
MRVHRGLVGCLLVAWGIQLPCALFAQTIVPRASDQQVAVQGQVLAPHVVPAQVFPRHIVYWGTEQAATLVQGSLTRYAQPFTQGQDLLPSGGTVTSAVASDRQHLQSQAAYEAQQMAARSYKGHVRGTIAGVRFCGVGWSSSSPNAPTCSPAKGMTLVADAVARGRDGWYRVRYWR